jgi:transposase
VTTAATSTTKLADDLRDVRRKLEQLVTEGRVADLIEMVMELLARMRDTNNALTVRLQNALRELYGKKSQKVSKETLASLLAALGHDVPPSAAEAATAPTPDGGAAPCAASPEAGSATAAAPEGGNVPQPPEPPKPPHGRGGRSPLPRELPRRKRTVKVPEAQRICPRCGATLIVIGYRPSGEILEFVPAHFEVIEEQREKLACPHCPEQGVVTAPSEKVMERGRPGPGLLAHILVRKFVDSMPLYRQTQEYEREGVSLSPSTLGDWSAFGLDVLAPVARRIWERVVGSSYMRGDDTGMRVLDRDHPSGVKLGHIWAFVGADFAQTAADGAPTQDATMLVTFHYAPTWKAEHPQALLQDFTGYFQGDGYAGYAAMLHDDDGEPIVPEARRLGCGMHIRAKFEKAAKAGDARAAVALAYFKAIYRVEQACKDEALPPDARKARRDEQSMPYVDELYKWIHELHPSLVPKTPLYVATQYAINQEAAWRRCFTDGRFEIDNGEVERRLRLVALGRKNYLFAGSEKGAERLAIAYTVFGSCNMNGVNPLAWATDVIGKLQDGWPQKRLDELLPDRWKGVAAAVQPEPRADTNAAPAAQPEPRADANAAPAVQPEPLAAPS